MSNNTQDINLDKPTNESTENQEINNSNNVDEDFDLIENDPHTNQNSNDKGLEEQDLEEITIKDATGPVQQTTQKINHIKNTQTLLNKMINMINHAIKVRNEIETTQTKLNTAKENLNSNQSTLTSLNNEKDIAQESLGKIKDELEICQLNGKVKEKENILKSLQDDLDNKYLENNANSRALEEAKRKMLSNRILSETVAKNVDTYTTKQKTLKLNIETLEKSIQDTQDEKFKISIEISEEYIRLLTENDKQQKLLNDINKKVEAQQITTNNATNEFEKISQELTELQKQYFEYLQKAKTLTSELEGQGIRLKSFEEPNSKINLENARELVKSTQEICKNQYHDALQELERLINPSTKAVEEGIEDIQAPVTVEQDQNTWTQFFSSINEFVSDTFTSNDENIISGIRSTIQSIISNVRSFVSDTIMKLIEGTFSNILAIAFSSMSPSTKLLENTENTSNDKTDSQKINNESTSSDINTNQRSTGATEGANDAESQESKQERETTPNSQASHTDSYIVALAKQSYEEALKYLPDEIKNEIYNSHRYAQALEKLKTITYFFGNLKMWQSFNQENNINDDNSIQDLRIPSDEIYLPEMSHQSIAGLIDSQKALIW